MNTVMFQSNSDEWATPKKLFEELDREFKFTLDPCATPENAKCKEYYTEKDNGLVKNWGGHCVFCNPPYSQISEWVKKCYYESLKPKTTVVLLVPARTDTKWFHKYIYHRAEIRFLKGRLKFSDSQNAAPFPSMLVIFRSAE